MPIPVVQFQRDIIPSASLAQHLFGALNSGLDLSKKYQMMGPEIQQAQLQQQLMQKYGDAAKQAEIASQNEKTLASQFLRQNPLLKSSNSNVAGIGAEMYLAGLQPEQQATDFNASKPVGEQLQQTQEIPNYANRLEERLQQTGNSKAAWRAIPATEKAQIFDQASAFGYSQDQTAKNLDNKMSLEDMAIAKGFGKDPSKWPAPNAPATQAVKTQQQKANIATFTLNAVSPNLTEAIAPYARTIKGYSPEQIADSLGKQSDQLSAGRAAGALAMQNELALIRARAGGASNVGIGMLEELKSSSLNDIKQLGISLSPDGYREAQRFIDEQYNIMNKAENEAFAQFGRPADWTPQHDVVANLVKIANSTNGNQ